MTRVLVAASTPALRLGVRALVEAPDIRVVGEAASLAARDVARGDVDVVVIGDQPLLRAGAAALLAERGAGLVVLAEDERVIPALLELPARAWGVVAAGAPAAEVQAAVQAVARGLTVIPAPLAARMLRGPVAPDDDGRGLEEPLTAREREVLELLGHGLSNRGIAARLGISEHTAKFHVASIYGKLGVSSRTQAVHRGVRRGLVAL